MFCRILSLLLLTVHSRREVRNQLASILSVLKCLVFVDPVYNFQRNMFLKEIMGSVSILKNYSISESREHMGAQNGFLWL